MMAQQSTKSYLLMLILINVILLKLVQLKHGKRFLVQKISKSNNPNWIQRRRLKILAQAVQPDKSSVKNSVISDEQFDEKTNLLTARIREIDTQKEKPNMLIKKQKSQETKMVNSDFRDLRIKLNVENRLKYSNKNSVNQLLIPPDDDKKLRKFFFVIKKLMAMESFIVKRDRLWLRMVGSLRRVD